MPDVSVLDVLLHGRHIGSLVQLSGDRTLFAFDRAYIDDPERPTLSLSFKDDLGALITEVAPTRTRLPPFFANLLPEGPLRDYLARRAGVKARREFYLLWVLGRDLPGAVTVRPADSEAWPPAARDDEGVDRRARALRFSLAGVQLKFSAVMEATGGLTIPASGTGGSWIVKLPSARFKRVPENEFAMMSLARAAGIDVPEIKLIPIDAIAGLPERSGDLEGLAFAIKRFDRAADGSLIHVEDFAQVFDVYPDEKYANASYRNVAEVLWREAGEDAIAELVRRLVFSALIGNADMHLKNWSVIYPDRRRPVLSPAYDLVSTIAYMADDKMALKLGRTKRMGEMTEDELRYLAGKAKLPETVVLTAARATVERFLAAWRKEKSHLPLAGETRRKIDAHLDSVPLAAGRTTRRLARS
jgi:serine/threonine-protein kinase HipA